MSGASGARVLLGVRGLVDDEGRRRVREALEALPGVIEVGEPEDGQVQVRYDDGETTVMDMIRALRRLGYLAGME
jgi:copper chaperone CopZ